MSSFRPTPRSPPPGGEGKSSRKSSRKSAALPTAPLQTRRLECQGLADYREIYDLQLELLSARQREAIEDTLLVVEHSHVITVGRSRAALSNVLAAGEVPVVEIERGGDVTYHGPGQLVVYPIVYLRRGEQDLHAFLRRLEAAMIDTLDDLAIDAGRVPGKTGVWVGPTSRGPLPQPLGDLAPHQAGDLEEAPESYARKIASIGIACRKWVTFHGLALNVTTDLRYFSRINPCGFDSAIMTSVAAERREAQPPSVSQVASLLVPHLAAALGRELVSE